MATSDAAQNVLVARRARIETVWEESGEVKSYTLSMADGDNQAFRPGQFVEIYIPGSGESTFAVSRIHDQGALFTVTVKRMGHNTGVLHRMAVGEFVGVRGPYGNHFPLEKWKGLDLVIVGGGIGLAPLRPVIDEVVRQRRDYGAICVLEGARSPREIIYRDDLAEWERRPDLTLVTTIDAPHPSWNGRVGLVPSLVKEIPVKPERCVAVICGPPIMIKFTVSAFLDLGLPADRIFTTLEMKMQCGIGQCGRCNIGGVLICRDGPVFCVADFPPQALS